jgi:hypothetical protein
VIPAPEAPRRARHARGGPRRRRSSEPGPRGPWIGYERLRATGLPAGSLDELVAGSPGAAPAVVEIATLAPAAREVPLMDIAALLYRGDRALARAQELREEARTADLERLQALIEEVCDLVALAHDAGG